MRAVLPPATLDKYKAAAGVASNAIAKLIEKAVAGAGVLELCEEGDKLVEQGTGALYNKDKNMQKGALALRALSQQRTIRA